FTIIITDALMGFDNVLGIASAADGYTMMLVIGVVISIPVIFFGSKLIAGVMKKRWIGYLGAALISWTAAGMMTEDKYVTQTLEMSEGVWVYLFVISLTAIILLLGMLRNSQKTDDI